MKSRRYSLVCYSAMVGLGVSFGAAAQQASTSEDLGEIVVTAQRRAERLVDVPISVTNLTSEQLTDANIVDLSGNLQTHAGGSVRFSGSFWPDHDPWRRHFSCYNWIGAERWHLYRWLFRTQFGGG